MASRCWLANIIIISRDDSRSCITKDYTPLAVGGFDVSSLTVDPETGKVDCSGVPGIEQLDFPVPAELCCCCGIELIPSGSRWRTWFCPVCRNLVVELNKDLGGWVIPVGRHSVMHGVGLVAHGSLIAKSKFEGLARELGDLFARMDRVTEWRSEIVRRNCAMTRLAGGPTVPIRDYLSAVSVLSKEVAFDSMCEWWASLIGNPTARRHLLRLL